MRSTPLGIPMYLQSDTPKGQSAVKLKLNHTQCLEKSLQTLCFINALIIIINGKKGERGAKERERMGVGGGGETETEGWQETEIEREGKERGRDRE